MAWNLFKEKFEKVILYFTFSEREKRMYRKYMMYRNVLESLTRKQKHALSIRLKSEFEYRKIALKFLIAPLSILVIIGTWAMFFGLSKERSMLFVKNIYTLQEIKTIWIIDILLFITVFILAFACVVVYLRNTYFIYKKLLLLEEIIEEEKKRNDKKRLVFREEIKPMPICELKTYGYDCPRCGGLIEELGVDNEYGFACDTCNYPYPDEE